MHNVPAMVAGRARCVLLVHPDDARRAGIGDGDVAVLESRVHSGALRVQVSDEMRPGVVSLPHGWGHAASAPWQQVAGRSTAPLLGRAGETAAALAPLVAVGLFFLVWHSWLVFLLVPLTGAVVYGNRYDRPRRRHRRYRRLGC